MKQIKLWIAIIVGMLTIVGSLYAFDKHYAKAERLEMVELRLSQKILQDRADWIQERIYRLEDRYVDRIMPQSVIEEYRRLKDEHRQIDQKLSGHQHLTGE